MERKEELVAVRVTKDELYYERDRYVKGDVIRVPEFWANMIVKHLKAGEFVEEVHQPDMQKDMEEGGNE